MGKGKQKLVTYEEAMKILKISRGTFYKRLALVEARGLDVEPTVTTDPRTRRPCRALRLDQVERLRLDKNGYPVKSTKGKGG